MLKESRGFIARDDTIDMAAGITIGAAVVAHAVQMKYAPTTTRSQPPDF